jgi:hypothetical protein
VLCFGHQRILGVTFQEAFPLFGGQFKGVVVLEIRRIAVQQQRILG